MNNKQRPQILLTNDDGIHSPGLWAAAEALSKIGYVTVAAPREQASASGRSSPPTTDGRIEPTVLKIGNQEWTTYAIGGTPAQTVQYAILEIMPQKPDLVVSGINYGENIGNCVTISGTVGAALEGASFGIPSLATSLEIASGKYLEYTDVDFSAVAYFTRYFAEKLLNKTLPFDVDALKLDVPYDASPETAWRITRVANYRYYFPVVRRDGPWSNNGRIDVEMKITPQDVTPDSDIYTLVFDRMVSVTPLSLDLTSRVSLKDIEQQMRADSSA